MIQKIVPIALIVTVLAMVAPASVFASTGKSYSTMVAAPEAEAVGHTAMSTSKLSQSTINESIAYVHVSNYYATIDPAIVNVLTTSDVQSVQAAVAHYNSLPNSAKQPHSGSMPSQRSRYAKNSRVSPEWGSNCPDSWTTYTNWWGWSIWLNHCFTNDLEFGLVLGTVGAGFVAALLTETGIGTLIAIGVAFILGAEAANLGWAINGCTNYTGNAWMNIWDPGQLPPPTGLWFMPAC